MLSPKAAKEQSKPKQLRQNTTLDDIYRHPDARPLDDENVRQLMPSIHDLGLLQPVILVVIKGKLYCVIGNHRVEAKRRNGDTYIDAIIWPEGTPARTIRLAALHENNIRLENTFEHKLQTVNDLAAEYGCSDPEAADMAGIPKGTFSKINTACERLCDAAMALIRQKKIGVSVCYYVAKGAKDDRQQLDWLAKHAAGEMSRDEIIEASKPTPPEFSGKPAKQITLNQLIDGIEVRAKFPANAKGEQLLAALKAAASHVAAQLKLGHDIDLLPRLLKSKEASHATPA